MMRIEQNKLIEQLLKVTEDSVVVIKELKGLSPEILNFKPNYDEWSILECVEHLNLYGDFYLPEIEHCILNGASQNEVNLYKSSFIGDFFVNSVKVGNKKKMTATKMMTPEKSNLSTLTLDRFLKQLEKLISLLDKAKSVNLATTKTAISLTRLFKLRLGDTLRFLVYHNERHLAQAEKMKLKAGR